MSKMSRVTTFPNEIFPFTLPEMNYSKTRQCVRRNLQRCMAIIYTLAQCLRAQKNYLPGEKQTHALLRTKPLIFIKIYNSDNKFLFLTNSISSQIIHFCDGDSSIGDPKKKQRGSFLWTPGNLPTCQFEIKK